ncbi:ankyrin repeat-containing domain protein [Aspergillus avenaceus]|uniref:Ankyrin repeat-containing domain protein n=1 Tax=Aspergillus avenaceus TaxID=36643 RepID=A0A5N6U343_ASPAV|nr:ankyrin repeat-containing domain protein [Aspergillus avenaceus]
MTSSIALDSPDLYTVGWITALPIERAAATELLDERHDKPCGFVQHKTDTNFYTWGRMGDHNVVFASLPAGLQGTASAATTASNLLFSFPQIKIGLLVGIGGGIPRLEQDHDIRLGDVVVSQPEGRAGGVVQYDLGKAKPNQPWERTGFLSMPPTFLLNALSHLQTEYERGNSRVPEFLKVMAQNRSLVRKGYVHQGSENDRLFNSSYTHVAGRNCCNCDVSEQVERDERDSTEPVIHYGVIASGNTLIRDAAMREAIVENVNENDICFEMEAAGLMNHFPCLVIRGVSDYADSHKNDKWRRYASATSAAYGKQLLSVVEPIDLQGAQRALDILKSMGKGIKDIQTVTKDTKVRVEGLESDSRLDRVIRCLSPPNYSTNFYEALKKRHKGTGTWFIGDEPFKRWKLGQGRYLWLHGIPGCGKTVLSATIIEHLKQQPDAPHVLLFFFFDFTDTEKQSLESLVCSLIAQLYTQCEQSRAYMDSQVPFFETGHRQLRGDALFSTFLEMVKCLKKVQIVIDALDECETREHLLSWLESLAGSGLEELRVLVTSRREEDIESELIRWIQHEDIISIQRGAVNNDIRLYVNQRLRYDNSFGRWRSKPDVQDEIREKVMLQADGMFRLAQCQLDMLQNCIDLRLLRMTLTSLPSTLQETYARILAGVKLNHRQYAVKLLQFLTYSLRPLTIEETVDVLAVDPDAHPPFDVAQRMPVPRDILKICPSLISVVSRKSSFGTVTELQLAHYSVQQYLKSGNIDISFPKEMAHVGMIFQKGVSQMSASVCIARTCLAYLSQFKEQLSYKRAEVKLPLAKYSARYWVDHALFAEADDTVQESIFNYFLQHQQVYNIWRKIEEPRWPWIFRGLSNAMSSPLNYASSAGLLRTVQRLLMGDRANTNAWDRRYSTALRAASANGHKEVVQLLLKNGADANDALLENEKDADLRIPDMAYLPTALQGASWNGHDEVVQILLDHGADVNAQIEGLDNALLYACFRGHKSTAQLLLESGADINLKSERSIGNHFLTVGYACQGSRGEVMKTILDNCATWSDTYDHWSPALITVNRYSCTTVNQALLGETVQLDTENSVYASPLSTACSQGHTEIVRMLLEKGADPNICGIPYGIALTEASFRGYKDIVQILLERGADPNIHCHLFWRDAYCHGRFFVLYERGTERLLVAFSTPDTTIKYNGFVNAFSSACAGGHREIVHMLLEKGADVNLPCSYYGSALGAACAAGYKKIVQLLLEKGADVNMQNGQWGSALLAACVQGHEAILELLLERGADVNMQCGRLGSALQGACVGGHKNIIHKLLEKGADVNSPCGFFSCALVAACALGHKEIVQLLLENGADVNMQCSEWGNALLTACAVGYKEIVQLLLEKGADVNMQCGEWGNALQTACDRGHKEIEKILFEKGARYDTDRRG